MADTLSLPEPFDLVALAVVLSERLGRPVEFVPLRAGGFGPCGVLVSTERAEYIGYPDDTSLLHQRHIVLHEVGHLLYGHGDGTGLAPATARTLLPNLSDELVRRVLGRSAYSEVQEREAELFASLVLHRAGARGAPEPAVAAADAGAAETVARLGSLFDVPARGHRAAAPE
ncbi:ParH-like protein [Kitasatospora sp. NPDC050543]|uniref:ParH-like protein n=1 Tax=Kitasatospora sp. NPDC050543 TaxID=3364054 RepID=UPI00379FA9FD